MIIGISLIVGFCIGYLVGEWNGVKKTLPRYKKALEKEIARLMLEK